MTFVGISTLDGGQIQVAADDVCVVTRALHVEGQPPLTRIELIGDGAQLTRMPAAEIAKLLTGAGARLAELNSPDGTPLYVSAPAVTAIRDADPRADPPGAHAVLTVAGGRHAVRQAPAAARKLIEAA